MISVRVVALVLALATGASCASEAPRADPMAGPAVESSAAPSVAAGETDASVTDVGEFGDTTVASNTAAPDTVPPDTVAPTTTAAPTTTETPATTALRPLEPGWSLRPPFVTATITDTFVDTSRVTAATPSSPELASRTLETVIVYPLGPGPFPLIVLSHGLTGNPARLSELSEVWARSGYVVALPTFPLTNTFVTDAWGNAGDVMNQPADVSFVIDNLLDLNERSESPLFDRVDGASIGVAGHSLGGATTYGVAYNSCCRDERISAVVILAGFILVNTGTDDFSRDLPILVIHGDADNTLPIDLDRDVFARIADDRRYFVTLLGGEHSSPFEDDKSPYDDVVQSTTGNFWNTYLTPHDGAPLMLELMGTVDGLSVMEHPLDEANG